VAAAANLRFALESMSQDFRNAHSDVDLKITYGSSGSFYAQLLNQAPFDVFLSADIEYPEKLVERGLAEPESLFVYAAGRLVVWVPSDSPFEIENAGVSALLDPSIRRIAIANPQHAPYGRAAESALRHFGLYESVRDRLVLGENITQAAQMVESRAAQAGIIALSIALAPSMQHNGKYWEIPPEAYPLLDQAGVILNQTKNRPAAERFREYLLGAGGAAALKQYGFLVNTENAKARNRGADVVPPGEGR
jgi:molybdate transport system substrate-binding protein